jgi:branched-chain amino acid transport system ATP-binding protein
LRPESIRRLGVVTLPEGHPVLTDLTVRDNLEVAGSGLSRVELGNAMQAALEVFPELQPKLKAAARELSGGQQQMLCLAQALISKPRFLLADELSLGLAPVIVQRLASVISGLSASGVGTLLIEQFTELALRISKHAYVLERGRMRFAGTSDDLRREPGLLESAYLTGA